MSSSVYPISFSKRIATSARAIRSSVQDTQGTCGTIRYSVPQSEEATDGSNISHQQLWIPCFRSWSVATNTLVAKNPPPPPPLCMGAKAKAPHGSLPDRCRGPLRGRARGRGGCRLQRGARRGRPRLIGAHIVRWLIGHFGGHVFPSLVGISNRHPSKL